MSDIWSVIIGFIFVLLIGVVGVLAMRWFNSVSNVVDVIQPKPGIECVVITTTDGVAADCNWGDK